MTQSQLEAGNTIREKVDTIKKFQDSVSGTSTPPGGLKITAPNGDFLDWHLSTQDMQEIEHLAMCKLAAKRKEFENYFKTI